MKAALICLTCVSENPFAIFGAARFWIERVSTLGAANALAASRATPNKEETNILSYDRWEIVAQKQE